MLLISTRFSQYGKITHFQEQTLQAKTSGPWQQWHLRPGICGVGTGGQVLHAD